MVLGVIPCHRRQEGLRNDQLQTFPQDHASLTVFVLFEVRIVLERNAVIRETNDDDLLS